MEWLLPKDIVTVLITIVTWGVTASFGAVTCFWLAEVLYLGRQTAETPDKYGPEAVQARILTIDAEQVVQETVDSLPAGVTDRHVIAETPIDVDGATVHVVPDDFECEAVRKGRALEWARREIACEKEYVLYLDEDSLVTKFEGLPDADIVQIRERPRRTGSFFTHLADIYRVGVQLEQQAFGQFTVPLFAWGGGIAVRRTVEDEVTWDRETLVEDTAFAWRAALWTDADYALADAVFTNQAPPSFREILEQRRRWAAGNHQEAAVLPRPYRWLTRARNAVWGFSPFAPVAMLPATFLSERILFAEILAPVTVVLAGFTVIWLVLGLQHYTLSKLHAAMGIASIPIATFLHSIGTIVGLLFPPEDFRVTKKIPRNEAFTSSDRSTEQLSSQSSQ